MRIALVKWSLARGGAEKQCVLAARELARAGHEVSLLQLCPPNAYADVLDATGVEVNLVEMQSRWRRLLTCRLREPLARGFDVIHAFDLPCLTDVLAAAPRRARVAAGCRAGQRLSFIREALIGRALRRRPPAGWIVNAPNVRDAVVHRYRVSPDDIITVPNALDTQPYLNLPALPDARRRFGLPAEVPVVSLVANFRPMKNHDMFFRVAKTLIRRGRAINFVLAGDGPLRSRIEAMRQAYELEAAVTLLGSVEDIPALLAATDILVLTSHPNTEGTPNVLLEAAAARCPVVATRCGIEHVLEDGRTGRLVDCNHADAMADAIEDLLDAPTRRAALARAACEHVQAQFATDGLAVRLLAAYNSLPSF